jgi:peptidase M28-like protein
MSPAKFSVTLCAALLFAGAIPALAQLSPSEPDPLARIRDSAKTNVQACSATGETLCEQVAPKILANAQGDSPLAENRRHLAKILKGHRPETTEESPAVAWAVAAFRDAGVEVHTEKNDVPAAGSKGKLSQSVSVVAEFRGREKPDDWVLLGAHLGPNGSAPGAIDYTCDAAEVIEAARDISQTSVHPRLSIRFVLFTGDMRKSTGSWAYARSHRSELDHARAAIMIRSDCRRMTDYLLNGRPEIEGGVREAMKPIDSFGADHFVAFLSSVRTEAFDFLLEGVPTVTAFSALTTISVDAPPPIRAPVNIADLKHNAAIVAVTAFGIAERATPLGPRQSRTEIEILFKGWDLEPQMKAADLWPLWESGQRGRMP